jgi:hypothetical protein
MFHSQFVNGNRTPAQRKARYCFIRCCGFNRDMTRILSSYSDAHFVKTYAVMQKCANNVDINPDFSPKI